MPRKNNQQVHFELASHFKKELRQAPVETQIAFRDAYEIFRDHQNSEALRNHSLDKQGKTIPWSLEY